MAITELEIENFLNNQDLQRTKEKLGTYFEQKITPDLLSFIAKAIIELTKREISVEFTDAEIRSSPFFKMMVKDYFSKPEQTEKTENEYNKVSSYQLGLLSFSKILLETGSHPKKFKINNLGILEFIAISDMHALIFLKKYVTKMLKDNNLTLEFETYKNSPTQKNYEKVKKSFWEWAKLNTSVRGNDPKHSYRVFNKIFNVYAYSNNLPGESKAVIRNGKCPYSYLIYNNINWRDKNKAKNVSREEFKEELEEEGIEVSVDVSRAKQNVKRKHPTTEVKSYEEYLPEANASVHAHHIFPSADYPKYANAVENIISLSVGQHFSYAHQGNTHWVNPEFQIICLLCKLDSIESSLNKKEDFYNFEKFVEIINEGLNQKISLKSSINEVRTSLKDYLKEFEEN